MLKKFLQFTILIAILAGLGYGGYSYFSYRAIFPKTSNAYLQANVIHIASQLSGPVKKVYVDNFSHVRKGDLLFEIDPRPYEIALKSAQAKLDEASHHVAALVDEVDEAKATVKQTQAELEAIKRASHRTMILVKQRLYPVAEADKATRDLKVALARLEASEKRLAKAQEHLGRADARNPAVRQAEAALEKAKLNLSYTRIVAPANGYVVKLTLRSGSEVTAFNQLFAIVEDNHWWVIANFKETELQRLRVDQPATIHVDMYPKTVFKGKIAHISKGSGASFALLPPENASGNWVKVTQRFPVQIDLAHPQPKYALRMGASCTVVVDTRKVK